MEYGNGLRALEMAGVCLSYGERMVLDHADFSLNYGELAFLTGESGSGKTTMINAFLGFTPVREGMIVIDGRALNDWCERSLRQHIAVVYQNLRLISHQSVYENVLLPLRFSERFRGAGGSRHPWGSSGCEGEATSRADAVLRAIARVGLSGMEDRRVSLLSGGEQQRVAIARAIAGGARIVMADEPTGNLDERNARIVVSVLEQLAEGGAAVLMTTHDHSLLGGRLHYHFENGHLIRVGDDPGNSLGGGALRDGSEAEYPAEKRSEKKGRGAIVSGEGLTDEGFAVGEAPPRAFGRKS